MAGDETSGGRIGNRLTDGRPVTRPEARKEGRLGMVPDTMGVVSSDEPVSDGGKEERC